MKNIIIFFLLVLFAIPIMADTDRMGSIEGDAVNDYCEFSNVVGLHDTFSNMTIDFWFYPIAYGGIGYIAPINRWNSPHWFLWVNNGNGKLTFAFIGSGVNAIANTSIEFNTWTHWTLTYDDYTQQATWYRNGIFDGGGISTVANPLNASTTQVIGRTADNLYGSARYDNMRMWDIAISSGLIEGLGNITYYGKAPHLVMNLLFNEESGAIIDTALGFKTDITNYTFTRESAVGTKQVIGK